MKCVILGCVELVKHETALSLVDGELSTAVLRVMELVLLCVALANDSNEVRRQAELDARRTRMVGSLPSHQLTQHL